MFKHQTTPLTHSPVASLAAFSLLVRGWHPFSVQPPDGLGLGLELMIGVGLGLRLRLGLGVGLVGLWVWLDLGLRIQSPADNGLDHCQLLIYSWSIVMIGVTESGLGLQN